MLLYCQPATISSQCYIVIKQFHPHLLPSHPNATMSHNSFIPILYCCLIHIALPSIHFPIHATFPLTLPLNVIVHVVLPYMLMSHAIILSPCYHLVLMLHCHKKVSSPPATLSFQCYNVTEQFHSHAMLLSCPHCPSIHALSHPCCVSTRTPT